MRDPMEGYDAWKTAEPDLPDPPEHNEANIEKLCQAKYDKMSDVERGSYTTYDPYVPNPNSLIFFP